MVHWPRQPHSALAHNQTGKQGCICDRKPLVALFLSTPPVEVRLSKSSRCTFRFIAKLPKGLWVPRISTPWPLNRAPSFPPLILTQTSWPGHPRTGVVAFQRNTNTFDFDFYGWRMLKGTSHPVPLTKSGAMKGLNSKVWVRELPIAPRFTSPPDPCY